MAKKGKKRSLRAALKNHQAKNEVAERAKAAEAAKIATMKNKAKGKKKETLLNAPKGKGAALPKKFVIPFEEDDRILLVGEGNFSFALSLIEHHSLPPSNVLATTIDTEEACFAKYPADATEIITTLRKRGVRILFGVDGTKLDRCKEVKNAPNGFNKIVFNFPHVGAGIRDQDRNIATNQQLLLDFLRSAAQFLARGKPPKTTTSRPKKGEDEEDEDEARGENDDQRDEVEEEEEEEEEEWQGTLSDGDGAVPIVYSTSYDSPAPKRQGIVLVTLRDNVPYTLWDLPRLAKDPPPAPAYDKVRQPRYIQLRSYRFWPEAYPGYEHRRTQGETRSKKPREEGMGGTGGVCRTWEFALKLERKEERPSAAKNGKR